MYIYRMDRLPKLNYDMIEYIMNIKEKEEKLHKIEITQKNNYKFVIKELEISFKKTYRYNTRTRTPISIVEYVKLQDDEILSFHHLVELKEDVELIKQDLVQELDDLFLEAEEEDMDILPSNYYYEKNNIEYFERDLEFFKRFSKEIKSTIARYDIIIFAKNNITPF